MINLTVNKKNPSVAVLLTVEYAKGKEDLCVQFGNANQLVTGTGVTFTSSASICRYLARTALQAKLYGSTVLEKAEVDHWLEFSSTQLNCTSHSSSDALAYLDEILAPITHLVGRDVTLADITVWAALKGNNTFQKGLLNKGYLPNVTRFYQYLANMKPFRIVTEKFAAESAPKQENKVRKEEGKFIELEGAEMGKVVVRFPPEASGYLHVGHAKAALLNQHYQEKFQGKLIMRFDDTNPSKESEEYEKMILEDVALLGIKPDMFTRTSDHFDRMLDLCEKMIRDGHAYVDNTSAEMMKEQREQRMPSACRQLSVAENLKRWHALKLGSDEYTDCCVRAKIDMSSDNGCMRDPTIYRCKSDPHLHTGTKYKVYPTYDFACPIVDSVEGVTHALRTTEYHDRDEQYHWFLNVLGLRKVNIWEYSRLNLQHTVMSKRKLTWFVNEGIVDGWDDPRLPTVRGVLRRGMTVAGLKEFVIAQGSSRSVVMMEWDKIWAVNKKMIDPVVARYTSLLKNSVIRVTVDGAVNEVKQIQKHPKNVSLGTKSVQYGNSVFIDGADAETLSVGEVVTFINWGNLVITNIIKSSSGNIESIEAKLDLQNTDYKKTQKLTWLAASSCDDFVPALCVHYEPIISKAILTKDDDFKEYVNRNTKSVTEMYGDPELTGLHKGDIIQLQRRGFYICDSAYEPPSRHSGRASPCILIHIPDGHTKQMPSAGSKHKDAGSAKEQLQTQKGKAAEKSPQEELPPTKVECKVSNTADAQMLSRQITEQGDKIREMKESKASKDEVDAAVKKLLALKAEYKDLTGEDLTGGKKAGKKGKAAQPGKETPATVVASKVMEAERKAPEAGQVAELLAKIDAQGMKVRDLKAQAAAKDVLDVEIKRLLELKNKYKDLTGEDLTGGKGGKKKNNKGAAKPAEESKSSPNKTSSQPVEPAPQGNEKAVALKAQIDMQGTKVRNLKSTGAEKAVLDAEIQQLLQLKKEYKELTGEDLAGGGGGKKDKKASNTPNKQAEAKKNKQDEMNRNTQQKPEAGNREVKKVTRLGLECKKEDNLSDWYSQVITKAELIEYYDVSGCYVLRPWAYSMWEVLSRWFDDQIKKLGFQNCYFPMFVSGAALEREKEHVEDFAPEVAWVTRSGNTELAEPIAIRPTSETVMYPSYAKWVQSHRDLPIKLNQWCSVVRWEFKHPQPFLRTREFLWQEGHSAHANAKDAIEEVHQILDLYAQVYKDLLAIPVVKGRKTEKEKFAGGDFTTTVEVYVGASGRAIQAATSHHLGQNFSRMFDISYEDPETKVKQFAYQNSWGITTRSIGIVVMVHADNQGLVLPPRIACVQVVLIPCGMTASLSAEEQKSLIDRCDEVKSMLSSQGILVKMDARDNYSAGWKFNHWELKGVPVRMEIGPRDVQQNQVVAVRRDTGSKSVIAMAEVTSQTRILLDNIQQSMLTKATRELEENMVVCENFSDFCTSLDAKKIIMSPFCEEIACEDSIKELSARNAVVEEGAPAMGAKSLCIPFNQPRPVSTSDVCIRPGCGKPPKAFTLFGRSY